MEMPSLPTQVTCMTGLHLPIVGSMMQSANYAIEVMLEKHYITDPWHDGELQCIFGEHIKYIIDH